MVDLVGIEPTTSSMPWKYQGRPVLTAKDLLAGTVGKTGKIGAICYQNATKIASGLTGADLWGISPILRFRRFCRRPSATASTGERFAIALSSSVASTWSAPIVFVSSICLFKTPAVTIAPRCFAVNTAERPTPPAAPATSTVWPALIPVPPEISSLPVVVTRGRAAAWIKSSPLGTLARRGTGKRRVTLSTVGEQKRSLSTLHRQPRRRV